VPALRSPTLSAHLGDNTRAAFGRLAAEQRITDLEGELERNRERAERAEQWLHRVYTEIEDRFVRRASGRARTMAR
jgi:hypothetical protein